EDFEAAICFASVTLPADGEKDPVTYLYQVTTATIPPVIEGQRFMTALLVVFATTLLLGLLIVALLRQKLAVPLRLLNQAFERLIRSDGNETEPVSVEVCSSCAIGGLLNNFNAMSTALYNKQRELREANLQISAGARELAQSKALLETTVESSPDAIIVTTPRGDIEFFNRAGRELFGYSTDHAPTWINDLFAQDVVRSGDEAGPANSPTRQERIGLRADGARFPSLVICAPLRLDGVRVAGFIYVIRDISESENYREMITRLDQLSVRGEMAGDIAHEINNFLAIIQGNAELLPTLVARGDQEKIERRLNAINSTVGRIAEFTNGLMHFEPRDLTFELEDPNQLAHNLLSFVKPQNRLDHVKFETRLDEHVRPVELDSAMIQQVLVNLIYNAADALKEHDGERRIVVSTRFGDSCDIIVSDSGPGVPEDKQASLFNERFTTKRKGNGIGLITCGRIAQAHNGSISYAATPEGGAQFTLTLPYKQPAAALQSLTPAPN
ncbi:MAG TPA: ATP-binding protein, partial [candidate division Zixibacteria bacterium]|nr:ATP-binding protein [candidate division Zixibacteria bacterium]